MENDKSRGNEELSQTEYQKATKAEILKLINVNNKLSWGYFDDIVFKGETITYKVSICTGDRPQPQTLEFSEFISKFKPVVIELEDKALAKDQFYVRVIEQTIGSEQDAKWCASCKKLTLQQAIAKHREAIHEIVDFDSKIHPEILNQGFFTPIGKPKGSIAPRPFHPNYGCEVCGNVISEQVSKN